MKFSSIILAAFGLTSFVAALPAPVADSGLEILKERDVVERAAIPDLAERAVAVDVVADVQVCIDAVVAINKKYSGKKYSSSVFKSWSAEIVVQIKLLISVITAYPAGCTYPSIDVVVAIFVKLYAAIFVQLKVWINLTGLLGALLLTVDILLAVLLSLVADLLNILVSLSVLIEAKIYVGLALKICVALKALIDPLYLAAFVKLLVKAGLKISL